MLFTKQKTIIRSMKIPLTQGKFAIVDAEDYDWLIQMKWYYKESRKGRGYAVKATADKTRMHRLVNNTPEGMFTDHINGDKLDNRKANLRSCTVRQNSYNSTKRSDNRSGYRGVCWRANRQRWLAQIIADGKYKYIGTFKTLQEAAQAYNNAAVLLHGEFAKLNIIDQKE